MQDSARSHSRNRLAFAHATATTTLHIVASLLGHAADSPMLLHFPLSSVPDWKEPVLTILVLPFTFGLLIPGPTYSQCLLFVIHSGVLLYTARPHSWTHRLVLSLLYLICSYFAVFFFSSNIKYDTSHMLCSSQSLTRLSSCRGCTSMSKALLQLQHFHVKLNSLASDSKTCVELFYMSDTLASTCLCDMLPHSHLWALSPPLMTRRNWSWQESGESEVSKSELSRRFGEPEMSKMSNTQTVWII